MPCFKYADSEDVILLTSRNIHYLIDKAGQFNENYYGMKHELTVCINFDESFVDLNDQHVFKKVKLSELPTESKIVTHAPRYLLQVQSRQQLINLLDLAIYVRNLSFFILILLYLRRASFAPEFTAKDKTSRNNFCRKLSVLRNAFIFPMWDLAKQKSFCPCCARLSFQATLLCMSIWREVVDRNKCS